MSEESVTYVVSRQHDCTSEHDYVLASSYDVAVKHAHRFFESYGFELRDGKPFDPGNDCGDFTEGFEVFDNVVMHEGKVAEFMHCGGDGPVCSITQVFEEDEED